MSVVKNIKLVHPRDITLIRIGRFYYTYGKDAYILSYIFGYKLNKVQKENIYSCAFPENVYNKVISKLENMKINYINVDRRNNYEVDEKSDNKNLNKYDEIFEKAKQYIKLKLEIDNIYSYMLENINQKEFSKIIAKVEVVLIENREI